MNKNKGIPQIYITHLISSDRAKYCVAIFPCIELAFNGARKASSSFQSISGTFQVFADAKVGVQNLNLKRGFDTHQERRFSADKKLVL